NQRCLQIEFGMYLATPCIQALCAQLRLLVFVQGKPHKLVLPFHKCLGSIKLVAIHRPVSNNVSAVLPDYIMQQPHGVQKKIAIPELVAESEQSNGLACKRYLRNIIPELFPVGLDLAEVPGRDS